VAAASRERRLGCRSPAPLSVRACGGAGEGTRGTVGAKWGDGLGFGGSGGLSRGRVGRSGSLVRRPVGPFGPVGQGGFLLLLFFFALPFIHFSFILVALYFWFSKI